MASLSFSSYANHIFPTVHSLILKIRIKSKLSISNKLWQNAFRSDPESNHIFLHLTFQLRTWFISCLFSYVVIIHLLRRGEGVGIYSKLIPAWIKSIRAWISFPSQYRTKFEILLGEVFQYTSHSKLGIWLCRQARIDLNSQSKFYDFITLDHKSTCPTQSTKQHTRNTFYI